MNPQGILAWITGQFSASHPLILMYHRIATGSVDPWGLSVSPVHFEEQLQHLRRTRVPLRLSEFVRMFLAGTLSPRAVAVTFDDGYLDNFTTAKPRLAAAGVPATIFLPTGYLNRPQEFWWDELARILLLKKGPRKLDFVIRGLRMHFDLGSADPDYSSTWRAWCPPQTARHAAYVKLWDALRRLDEDERIVLMSSLRSIFASHTDLPVGRAMTNEEAGELIADNLIEIGAHTVTHPMLTGLEPVDLDREIQESRVACEKLTGYPVPAFAYPYGDFDPRIRAAVTRAGFKYAFSTENRPVTAGSDPFSMPRIQVLDSPGRTFRPTFLTGPR